MDNTEINCPECKSTDVIKYGKKWKNEDGQRVRKQRRQCNTCGYIWNAETLTPEAAHNAS